MQFEDLNITLAFIAAAVMMVAAGSLSISLNLCNAAAGEAFWPEAATRCALATATTATTHTPATHEIAPFLPKRWLHHDMTI